MSVQNNNINPVAGATQRRANDKLVHVEFVSGFLASMHDAWRVSRLALRPLRHLRLSWLLSRPPMREFSNHNSKLHLKYLVEYASKSITTQQRYQVLYEHYAFLQKRFQPRFLREISTCGLRVWEHSDPNVPLTIDLDFPEKMQTEGDLCLTLRSNKDDLYRLIFSITSGTTFDLVDSHVIFVTCVQGLQSGVQLRVASNCCHDVHPSDLLMAALAGVAGATDIDKIIGITTANQIANKGRIFFSYNDFFAKYGHYFSRIDAYQVDLPYRQKAVRDIAAKYRSRTRAKRSIRSLLTNTVRGRLVPYLH